MNFKTNKMFLSYFFVRKLILLLCVFFFFLLLTQLYWWLNFTSARGIEKIFEHTRKKNVCISRILNFKSPHDDAINKRLLITPHDSIDNKLNREEKSGGKDCREFR